MTLDSFNIKKELNFALSCIQKNNHLDAIKIYEKILKENDNNSEANSNLGMLYAQNNNLDKAEKHLIKAIKVDVKNPYLLNNLASILIRLGRNNESITHSKNAIRIKKNFSLAYNNLGLAQKNIEDNEDSIKNVLSYPLKEAREKFEKDYLTSQIKKHKGNISKTAEFVGMERSALHRKLKALGIKGIN